MEKHIASQKGKPRKILPRLLGYAKKLPLAVIREIGLIIRNKRRKKVLTASLLHPKNLFVLGGGILAGILLSSLLIPWSVLAYLILCYLHYLDLTSSQAGKTRSKPSKNEIDTVIDQKEIRSFSDQQKAQKLETKELQNLQADITSTKDKIQQLYDSTDDFTQALLVDFPQIKNLAARSDEFLLKAQTIRNYLASENIEQIKRNMTSLQAKIRNVSDSFSRQQYQQALNARHKHLDSLRDIQQVYERLVSQLTNISISLDSMYSRMMKLKTSEYSLASAESDQVSAQLDEILRDVEQLDTALNENLGLPE